MCKDFKELNAIVVLINEVKENSYGANLISKYLSDLLILIKILLKNGVGKNEFSVK